ncbi:MAG: glycosyltransferase [Anaerolineales bacterium]
MTILQAASYRAGSNRGIATTIGFLEQVLNTGDAFSVCAGPQEHVLVGELAMIGRLNNATFGFDFVHTVLPGSPPKANSHDQSRNGRSLMSSHGIADTDFVVLWCGGYNAWTDVETLYRGLDAAMSRDPRIHFVSVGASTYEGPDDVYAKFLDLIDGSVYQDRFHMLGWQPWSGIADFYRDSDVGINIDAWHYETVYGTRTRLVEMIGAGLPVITSSGSELSSLLSDGASALSFEIGDWEGFGQQILTLCQDEERRRELANNALGYAESKLSFSTTMAPVRAWVQQPRRAPDKAAVSPTDRLRQVEHRARSMVRHTLWRVAGVDK